MSLGAWEGQLLAQSWLEARGKRVPSDGAAGRAVGSAVGALGLAATTAILQSTQLCTPLPAWAGIEAEPLKVFLLVMFSRKDHRCIQFFGQEE